MSTHSYFIQSIQKVLLFGFFMVGLFLTKGLNGQQNIGPYNIMLKDGWKHNNAKSNVSEHYLFEKDGMSVAIPKSPQDAPGGVNKFIMDYANKLKGTDEFIEQQKQSIPVALYGKSQSARLTIKSKSTGARRFVYLTMVDNKVYETLIEGNAINTDPAPEAIHFLSKVSVDKNAGNKTYAGDLQYRTASATPTIPSQVNATGTPASGTPSLPGTSAVNSDADSWIENMVKFLVRIDEGSTAIKLLEDYKNSKKVVFGDTRNDQENKDNIGGAEAETDGNGKITIKKTIIDDYNSNDKLPYGNIPLEWAFTIIHEYKHVEQVSKGEKVEHIPKFEDPAEDEVWTKLNKLKDKLKNEFEALGPDLQSNVNKTDDIKYILEKSLLEYINPKLGELNAQLEKVKEWEKAKEAIDERNAMRNNPLPYPEFPIDKVWTTPEKHISKWKNLKDNFNELLRYLNDLTEDVPLSGKSYQIRDIPDIVNASELYRSNVFIPNSDKAKIKKYEWTPCSSGPDKNKQASLIQFSNVGDKAIEEAVSVRFISANGKDIGGASKKVTVIPVIFPAPNLLPAGQESSSGPWGAHVNGLFKEQKREGHVPAKVYVALEVSWCNSDCSKKYEDWEKETQKNPNLKRKMIALDDFQGFIYQSDFKRDCRGSGYVDLGYLDCNVSGKGFVVKGCLGIQFEYNVYGTGVIEGEGSGFCKFENLGHDDSEFLKATVLEVQQKVMSYLEGIKLVPKP